MTFLQEDAYPSRIGDTRRGGLEKFAVPCRGVLSGAIVM